MYQNKPSTFRARNWDGEIKQKEGKLRRYEEFECIQRSIDCCIFYGNELMSTNYIIKPKSCWRRELKKILKSLCIKPEDVASYCLVERYKRGKEEVSCSEYVAIGEKHGINTEENKRIIRTNNGKVVKVPLDYLVERTLF